MSGATVGMMSTIHVGTKGVDISEKHLAHNDIPRAAGIACIHALSAAVLSLGWSTRFKTVKILGQLKFNGNFSDVQAIGAAMPGCRWSGCMSASATA